MKSFNTARHFLIISALLCWSSLSLGEGDALAVYDPPMTESAGQTVVLPNNFSDVETWDYPSGLRVHFKAMPHVSNVYVTASLPVGSSHDPRGLEGLAHFVEHMVFTDHRGKTEEEIKQSVLDRGGRKNATTSRYLTRYYVDLPASDWEFGVNWMHDLLTDHRFSANVVDAERKVVMLEKSRREPNNIEPLDRAQIWLLGRNLLVPSDFWEREFGLEREHRGVLGSYTSLSRISTADIQQFYDRYYGPQNLTLMVVGNVDRAQVKALVDRTFGSWPESGELVQPNQPARDSGGLTERTSFSQVKNVDHRIHYKLYSPSAYDMEMAYFSARFLRHLLNQRLRMEHKATYGVTVAVDAYAGHAALGISGNYASDDLAKVSQLIDEVLAELKAGQLDELQFNNFRGRAVSDMYMGYQTATAVANWCNVHVLCNKEIYQDFPDKISHWQSLSQAEFGAWLSEALVDSRKVVEVTRPIPASLMWLEILGPLLAVFLVFAILQRCWKQPVDMTEIRYISKLRYPVTLMLAALGLAALVGFVLVLGGFHGYERISKATSLVDSYLFQRLVSFALLGLAAGLVLTLPAMAPRKLLLFAGGWRLKFWSFRSAAYRYEDIREMRECSFLSLLLSRRAFGTVFLHWGLWRKGVYVRVGDRFGYFLRVRDNRELMEQFQKRGVGMHGEVLPLAALAA